MTTIRHAARYLVEHANGVLLSLVLAIFAADLALAVGFFLAEEYVTTGFILLFGGVLAACCIYVELVHIRTILQSVFVRPAAPRSPTRPPHCTDDDTDKYGPDM